MVNDELLNIYDAMGAVVGALPRAEATRSGHAVGAVQLFLLNPEGRLLLQQRVKDKENGGLWDKSVGGHVLAGESFEDAFVRETAEELLGGDKHRVRLVSDAGAVASAQLGMKEIVAARVRTELNLRDVRLESHASRTIRNVTYHAAMFLGRTSLTQVELCPQADELADLRFVSLEEIDQLLVDGELAPNMAFFYFALGSKIARLSAQLLGAADLRPNA